MTTKTISLNTEAFERLEAAKRGSESFSEVVKRFVPKPRTPIDLDAWMREIEADPVSDEFVTAVENFIADRRGRYDPGM